MLNVFKRARYRADEWVICWTDFQTDGVSGVIRRGDALRGDHRAVVACPDYFVRKGTPVDEWPTIGDLIQPTVDRVEAEAAAERATRAPKPIPAERRVQAIGTILQSNPFREVPSGALLDIDDDVVKSSPELFTWPARPVSLRKPADTVAVARDDLSGADGARIRAGTALPIDDPSVQATPLSFELPARPLERGELAR